MSEADTIARLRRALMLAEAAARHEAANADHWRANHANLVARCALLRERPDLPVDRIPAYDELVRLQDELLRLQQERMEMTIAGAVMARWLLALSQSEATPDSWRMTSAELAQAWQDAQPGACDEPEGSLALSQDRIAELEAALARQPASEGLTHKQIDQLVRAACHSDPTTKDGEYCLTVDELHAILSPVPPAKAADHERVQWWLALQRLPCPYNERDHGPNWHVSAHAWTEGVVAAMRVIDPARRVPAAPG